MCALYASYFWLCPFRPYPFFKSYTELYFDAKHQKTGLNRGWYYLWCTFFSKKGCFLINSRCCPNLLDSMLEWSLPPKQMQQTGNRKYVKIRGFLCQSHLLGDSTWKAIKKLKLPICFSTTLAISILMKVFRYTIRLAHAHTRQCLFRHAIVAGAKFYMTS